MYQQGTNEHSLVHGRILSTRSFQYTNGTFPIRYFRLIWQLPNCKIVIFVDVWVDVKQNYEIRSLYHFKKSLLLTATALENFKTYRGFI